VSRELHARSAVQCTLLCEACRYSLRHGVGSVHPKLHHPQSGHAPRQFRKEEERSRLRGDYAPPGLLTVAQFRHAWKKCVGTSSKMRSWEVKVGVGLGGDCGCAVVPQPGSHCRMPPPAPPRIGSACA
jgi:hypothetical protein